MKPGTLFWIAVVTAALVNGPAARADPTLPRIGSEPAVVLCVVFEQPAMGLESDPFNDALGLEQRKARLPFNRVVVTKPENCPGRSTTTGAVATVAGLKIHFDGPEGTVPPFDAGSLDPMDRAHEAARWIVLLFAAQLRGERGPVDSFIFAEPDPEPSTLPGIRKAGVQAELAVGGLYEFQPGPALHLGTMEISGGVSLLEERLVVGLRLGYQPAVQIQGNQFPVLVQSIPLSLFVKGGWLVEPVLIRLGLGIGLDWRRFALEAPQPVGDQVRSHLAATLAGELEAVVRLPESVRLSLAASVRGFLGGTAYQWEGQTVYESPRYSVGAVLRLGYLFPGETGRGRVGR